MPCQGTIDALDDATITPCHPRKPEVFQTIEVQVISRTTPLSRLRHS